MAVEGLRNTYSDRRREVLEWLLDVPLNSDDPGILYKLLALKRATDRETCGEILPQTFTRDLPVQEA